MFKRTEESKLTSWFFEIDRVLLSAVLIMICIGIVFSVSAGSVAAERIHMPWYFFAYKAIPFWLIGITTLLLVSAMNKKTILGLSVLNVVVGLLLLMITVIAPHTIKGSARFVSLAGFNIMPSDIMKPGFIILTAYFLSYMRKIYGDNFFINKNAWRFKLVSFWPYLLIFLPALFIIFHHPDFGTSILYLGTVGCMTVVAGLPLTGVISMMVLGCIGGLFAFFTMSHVHNRVMQFFTGQGDGFQVRQSIDSIKHGGLIGSGEDAFIKQSLPDAHTDFIFAAFIEDFGAICGCLLLCGLFYVFARLIKNALKARDDFVFFATCGAAFLFVIQVCINMASTLHIIPPKGMTLPFISYGGSSLVAYCLLFGMVLALIREDKWK